MGCISATPALGGQRQAVPEAHWPTSLNESVSTRFKWEKFSQNVRRKSNPGRSVASAYLCTHGCLHAFMHIHINMLICHIHMQDCYVMTKKHKWKGIYIHKYIHTHFGYLMQMINLALIKSNGQAQKKGIYIHSRNIYNSSVGWKEGQVVKRGHYFCRRPVQFPAPMPCSSQLPVAPDPGDCDASVLWEYVHLRTHSCTDTKLKTMKIKD